MRSNLAKDLIYKEAHTVDGEKYKSRGYYYFSREHPKDEEQFKSWSPVKGYIKSWKALKDTQFGCQNQIQGGITSSHTSSSENANPSSTISKGHSVITDTEQIKFRG